MQNHHEMKSKSHFQTQRWVKFQKDARVARREAEIAAEKKRKETIELIIVILAVAVLAATIIGFFYWILWLKGIVKWP